MKKKIISFLLSLTILMSLGYASVFATERSTNAGKYGKLTGISSGDGPYVRISTSITNPAHLRMHSVVEDNRTGAYLGKPSYTEEYGTTYISDEIYVRPWASQFTSNIYAVYTTHELIGTTNYAVYTVATGDYTL